MRKLIAFILIASFCLVQGVFAANLPQISEKEPLDLPIKLLRSAPDHNANIVFDIPLEVKLLDVSDDGNWHKVKISYWIGPFQYTYVGWSHIPVTDALVEREILETANLLEEN